MTQTTQLTKEQKIANAHAWLKKNNAKSQLVMITTAFKPVATNTKTGKRVRYNFSVVPVGKGQKFDYANGFYVSKLVNNADPSKTDNAVMSAHKGLYGITYRDEVSDYKGKKHIFHKIIGLFDHNDALHKSRKSVKKPSNTVTKDDDLPF